MAINFLWQAGTSNSGLVVSSFNLLTTELNSLTNTSLIASSVGGASGKFTNSNTGQAIWGEIFLTLGAISSPLAANPQLNGWFLVSPDSGSTLESKTVQPPRNPDFIVPLPATTIGAGSVYKASGLIKLSALQFFVLVQNSTGQTFAASANTLQLATTAVQY